MMSTWTRLQKKLSPLVCGGMTLGILQGFEMVNFADVITSLLVQWLSAIVSILLGGTNPFAA
jgi:hypothetical protein